MVSDELMLKIENVSKIYRLGEIGGTTLRDELQRLKAKIRHKEDPTKKIGAKNYNKGEKFKALDNISFEVKKGERIGIIGHNGAGKSTLLKLISRVTGPTEGNIHLNGRVASMLEVGTGFHPELTGRENVYMNGAILGMTKKEIDAKMEDIIEFSEVRQFIDTPVKRYSSGMYVKLAFSVAAHLDSEIMIMDEVLAVGDMAFQNKCLTKMRDVSEQQDKTILYVSHNMNTIRQLCNRVIVLNHGTIVFDGDVEEGIKRYLGVYSEDKLPVEYDMSQKKRIYDFGKYAKLLYLKILNKQHSTFEGSEKMSMDIKAVSYKKMSRGCFIFTILDSSGNRVGATSTSTFVVNENETIDKRFEFDLSNIAYGRYFIYVAFADIGDDKSVIEYDDPAVKVFFEIVDSRKTGFKWDKKYYGNVYFPQAKEIL